MPGSHIELILFLLNAETAHHIEEKSHHVIVLVLHIITEEVGHLQGSHHGVVLALQVIIEEASRLRLMMRAN